MQLVYPTAGRAAILAATFAVAITCSTGRAQQQAPVPLTVKEAFALTTVTPLGEAAVNIPAGTILTNYVVEGEMVRISQGPFAAKVELGKMQQADQTAATGAQQAEESAPQPASTPETAAKAEATESNAGPASTAPPARVAGDKGPLAGLPPWAVPATLGALLAYALFATVALLRRPRAVPAEATASAKPDAKAKTPVVAIAPKAKTATPAVVSEGGRAIACPLCAKSIPMEKISKGRNVCPSCGEAFVGE